MNLWSLKFVILTALQALSVALCDSVLSTSAEGTQAPCWAASIAPLSRSKRNGVTRRGRNGTGSSDNINLLLSQGEFAAGPSIAHQKDLCTCVGHGLIKCEDEKN
ncbi:hypothetical protein JOQ06_026522, partial [Pogonophryne albipinna]